MKFERTDNIGTAGVIELETIVDKTNEGVEDIMRDTDETGLLPHRELRGLYRTLRTIGGTLVCIKCGGINIQKKKKYYREKLSSRMARA